ncbi:MULTISPECIES: LapA family protein [Prauserella salsuginis group]|uniref:LapA family protein n=2 Tax=Prauserella salsuginis group TaxID=2893672 RepID=A0ABW6G3V3_9PSEU|nr:MULTISPECIES: LapA family protein [Prauserella salsuginis group]MBB3664889.1 putative integral membrane protein [Prauserella sediminis]MCR3718358.1 Protein of unknown function (DUF1049) [Prauserella flava]MCR3732928.1 Protein of unknown function (DUF1049) [Prauserella salsuginis]
MTAKPGPHRRFHIGPRQVVALLVAVVVVLFVVQNRDVVDMHLFTIVVSAPLWTALVVVAALGALAGFLLTRKR